MSRNLYSTLTCPGFAYLRIYAKDGLYCEHQLVNSKQWIKRNYTKEATQFQAADAIPVPTTLTMRSTTAESPTVGSEGKSKRSIDYIIKSTDPFTKVELAMPTSQSEAYRKAMSFDDMPGPRSVRYLQKLWSIIPFMGTQVIVSVIQYMLSGAKLFGGTISWGGNTSLFRRMFHEYGPILRLHGPFGGNVVVLNTPEDVSTVFQNEGRFPIRASLDCVEKYRLHHRKYKRAGPFFTYGTEWEKLRTSIEPLLHDSLIQQHQKIEYACDEFVVRIERIRNQQEEVPKTFNTEIYKWAMECMCSVTLNRKLGFLDPCGLSSSSEPAMMLEALNGATDAIRRCESWLHLWKYVNTPAWNRLVKHCDVLDTISNKYIHKAQESLRLKKSKDTDINLQEVSFLEILLLKDGLLPEDVLTIFLDMMLIGVNAVSHGIAFLLYNLARNPRTQRKLYDEIQNMSGQITNEEVTNMKYLQACIKESLRLKPPMPILNRVLTKDVLLHNYRIPKDTFLIIATYYASLREEYFEDATKFKPERWIDDELYQDGSVFATLPFGYGPKACLGKNLAETQIALLLIKIIKKYRVEYHYGDINSNNRLIAAPTRPLKFRFVDRLH